MNAHALLTSQGWRGKGHSLHPTNDDQGLTHHILIKRNDDGRGLGSKKEQQADAWWLNAFDQALKGIDTRSGTMKQTLKGGALEKIAATKIGGKYTGIRGLYASFVKGGVMEGTVDDPQAALLTPPDSGAGTPTATTASVASNGDEINKAKKKATESKEERRARREAKRLRKAEKQARREAEERAARKLEKKKAKRAEKKATKETETKEERRARRDLRRKRKEEKRKLKAP
ncbi:hypothetical protein F4809DRAFT_154713 [Biscogniauxia mediterranea]|nr:hypothetical protein F4809DRAFT_154713 [Biscogniauxia mediterranea]